MQNFIQSFLPLLPVVTGISLATSAYLNYSKSDNLYQILFSSAFERFVSIIIQLLQLVVITAVVTIVLISLLCEKLSVDISKSLDILINNKEGSLVIILSISTIFFILILLTIIFYSLIKHFSNEGFIYKHSQYYISSQKFLFPNVSEQKMYLAKKIDNQSILCVYFDSKMQAPVRIILPYESIKEEAIFIERKTSVVSIWKEANATILTCTRREKVQFITCYSLFSLFFIILAILFNSLQLFVNFITIFIIVPIIIFPKPTAYLIKFMASRTLLFISRFFKQP